MFSGYGFFDYKYNIPGYAGQDYQGMGRYLYMGVSLALLLGLSLFFAFRKPEKEKIVWYLRIAAIAFTASYIIKTTWESYFDIATGRGFNWGLLPLDTCSIVMPACFLAGFGKGKFKEIGEAWLVTGAIVGGLSNLLFLQALKYYPFFTFGAFYSMLWHFFMVFTGLFLWVTRYVKPRWIIIVYAMILHTAVSLIAIPLNYAYDWDFMLYRYAGGIPLFEGIADRIRAGRAPWLVTPMVYGLYIAIFACLTALAKGDGALMETIQKKKESTEEAPR